VEGAHAGQYFEAQPASASRPHPVTLALADLTLDLVADRGVFAADAVDPGTRYLLQEAPLVAEPGTARTGGHLLDLGCGYGPVAVTLGRRRPAATVWAVDVNERAVALTRANAERNHVGNVRAIAAADPAAAVAAGMPDDVRFTAIWSNPPIRIGKAALHVLLAGWLARLEPGGRACFVVHKHLGSDSLARWLTGQGWATTRLSSRAGYRLLDVTAA
jgi:16S rRNA (guanine1207-N2)-methyltransferase